MQNHSGITQQQTADQGSAVYRAAYQTPQEYYNGGAGAVPRSSWHGDSKPTSRNYHTDEYPNNSQSVSVQIENKEQQQQKDAAKSKAVTKTYHTIKDMISGRFKASKDNEEKTDDTGLNNVSEEHDKKTAGEQGIYGKPRTEPSITMQQHQYNQHIIHQHIIAQQAMQYQYKNQVTRSQEMLVPKADEQAYYQYGSAPQRPQNRYGMQQQPSNYVPMHHQKETPQKAAERRSAQQIERDNLRQKCFEARRAASHPQLAYEDQVKGDQDNRPQPQTAHAPVRRGSHGNLIEATGGNENEKDSDDGGFLKRNNSKDKRSEETVPATIEQEGESKVSEALSGTPRKRLEGEIGKIEGVYNVGQRGKVENEDVRNLRKHNTGSGASSDYDKAGQSSSNADSGRGSAAYSSGRRPGCVDLQNECDNFQTQGNVYRDHSSGKCVTCFMPPAVNI